MHAYAGTIVAPERVCIGSHRKTMSTQKKMAQRPDPPRRGGGDQRGYGKQPHHRYREDAGDFDDDVDGGAEEHEHLADEELEDTVPTADIIAKALAVYRAQQRAHQYATSARQAGVPAWHAAADSADVRPTAAAPPLRVRGGGAWVFVLTLDLGRRGPLYRPGTGQ